MIYADSLSAKVAAVNSAHAYAQKLYNRLAPFFASYVGQPIFRKDGTLLKRIAAALPEFPDPGMPTTQLSTYQTTSDYSLAWTVKACQSCRARGCELANYYEITVYIGDVRDGVLTAISKPPTGYRTGYTVAEVRAAQQAVERAKEALSAAQSDLHPFGEYD